MYCAQQCSPWRSALALVAASTLFGGSAYAQVTVPGTYPDPQTALDSSPPGTTIIVQGGTWDALTITKSVTLIGDPRARFRATQGPNFHLHGLDPAVFLAGPGSGEVTLSNIETLTDNGEFLPHTFAMVVPGIAGSGFDELHVYDSTIRAVDWTGAILSGFAQGEEGIDVQVPFLWLERCTVAASMSTDDGTGGPGSRPAAAAGIRQLATGAQAVVLDTIVYGGSFDRMFLNIQCESPCPGGGTGGAAVHAVELFDSGAQFYPGSSADWFDDMQAYCCTAAPGSALLVSQRHSMNSSLFPASSPRIGRSFTLHWSLSHATGNFLFWGPEIIPAVQGGLGTLFLDTSSGVQSAPIPATGSMTWSIPNDSAIIGFEACFQALEGGGAGFSRPVSVIARP